MNNKILPFIKIMLLATTINLIMGCSTITAASSIPSIKATQKATQQPKRQKSPTATFMASQGDAIKQAYEKFKQTGAAPIIQTKTFIQFPYGNNEPIIECSPLHTCDLALQPNEIVTGIYPGDTARWLYEEAVSGTNSHPQTHIIFKPKEADIATNAIITTSKHTYHIGLLSQKNIYVRQASFYYPEELTQQLQQLQKEETATNLKQNAIPLLEQLDFNYRIQTPWFNKPVFTPTKVFNDGKHVYLQMPKKLAQTVAPALFQLEQNQEPILVNYRIQGGYYIVDNLFQRAALVSGTGSNQQRVIITYNG